MKEKNKFTICLIGGHLAPAEALAEHIVKNLTDLELEFIGRKKSFTNKEFKADSVEKKVMQQYTSNVTELPIERLTLFPASWFNFVKSVIICVFNFVKNRPDVVVSFGGYVAVPVGVAALLCRIPLLIHEQTHSLGSSNKIFAKLAAKVCVSFRDQVKGKFIYTGFPLRLSLLTPPEKLSFKITQSKPILYISGGTTGAVAINDVIYKMINNLTKEWVVVHQTGNLSLEKALKTKKDLDVNMQNNYVPLAYVLKDDVAWLLNHATCVLSRAGANTVYELAYIKTPSVLIPLPNSAANEQLKNADWLKNFAPTVILKQESLTPESLIISINECLKLTKEKRNYEGVPLNGVDNIVFEIRSLLT